MSDDNKPCPKCGGNVSQAPKSNEAECGCGWKGRRAFPKAAPPSPPQAPQAKRVRTSDAANDIENAFKAWEASVLHAAANEPSVSAAQAIIFAGDCGDARARVIEWLSQVMNDQRQLHAALLACQAMAAAETDIDRWEATRLATIALETK